MVGMVTQIVRRTTKNGDIWASVTLEDLMRPSPSPVSQRFISEWNPC
ncbi:DNA polymerase III alpha subunit [Cutibacterium acnes JCM 18918]|nr:DNA polymerase III alpha subunit [Cutibacterium acnes JCM 18918]